VFTERQRKRIETMIVWADLRAAECEAGNRPGAANHHRAKASALRAALAEIDKLNRAPRSARTSNALR
jgi:hypothetical protein